MVHNRAGMVELVRILELVTLSACVIRDSSENSAKRIKIHVVHRRACMAESAAKQDPVTIPVIVRLECPVSGATTEGSVYLIHVEMVAFAKKVTTDHCACAGVILD